MAENETAPDSGAKLALKMTPDELQQAFMGTLMAVANLYAQAEGRKLKAMPDAAGMIQLIGEGLKQMMQFFPAAHPLRIAIEKRYPES